MANNDYITTDCKLTVSKNTAKLDEEIFLYKNDRNIKLLIEIVDNKYRYKSDDLSNLLVKYKASYAQVKWYKNAEVKKEFPIQATDDGKVVFVIEGQLIDEDTELGDYDLQLRLLNESQESIRSLPTIKGAVHILKPLFEEGDIATVNSAVADVSMLSLDGDAIDTYNSDGTYNQTNWGNGDVISSAKLNKLEKVAKDNVDKVNKMPAKSIVEGGKIYLAKEDGTKLDSGTELPAGGSTIEVVNNLESDSTTAALSAAQGKALNTQYKDIANGLKNYSTEFDLNMQNVLYNDSCEILEENNNYLFTCEFYKLTSDIIKFETSNTNFTNFHVLVYDNNYSLLSKINVVNNEITINSLSKEPKYVRISIKLNAPNDDIKIKCLKGLKEIKTDNIDYIVASKDATDKIKENADMVCNGIDDAIALRHAMFIAYYLGKQLILSNGDYILDSTINYETNIDVEKTCLWYPHYITPEQFDLTSRFFTLKGNTTPIAYKNGTRLIVSQRLYNSLGTNDKLSVIRGQYQTSADVFSGGVSFIELKNLIIYIPGNKKRITAIDLNYSYGCILENINCTTLDPTMGYGYHKAPPIPAEGCYGILGVMGSNWNILNTFKNIECMGFYVGIDISGEHCFAENISMKYNYYGFTFNSFKKLQGAHHHPITCINLLDEHSMTMPLFGAGTYYITGYNLMYPHSVTFENVSYNDIRHKLAQNSNNNAYGYVYYNCNTTKTGGIAAENQTFPKFFMDGHGKNMRCYNSAHKYACTTSERISYDANYMQQVFDTDLNQLCIYTGTQWVLIGGTTAPLPEPDITDLQIIDNCMIEADEKYLQKVDGCKSYKVPCKPNTAYKVTRNVVTSRFNVCCASTLDLIVGTVPDDSTQIDNMVYTDATNTDLTCNISTTSNAKCLIIWFSRNGEQSDLNAKFTIEEVK